MTDDPGTRFVSYLALSAFGTVDFDRLRDQMARQFPTMPIEVELVRTGSVGPGQRGFVLSVSGVTLAIMFIDAPLPPPSYAEALQLDRIWPKQAAEAMGVHRAHVVIGMVRPISEATALAEASIVTLVCAALAELLPVSTMIWTTAQTITSPAALKRNADSLASAIPAEMWVQFRWLDGPRTAAGERSLAVLTKGLQPFVGRELEFAPRPLEPRVIAIRLLGTCQYLIANGAVIKDGETLGVSDSEVIRVRAKAQGQRPGVPIYELNLERLDPSDAQQPLS